MKTILCFLVLLLLCISIYPQTQTTFTDLGRLSSKTPTTPGVNTGSAVYGSYLYNSGDFQVYIYKATDPKNPTFIKTIPSLTSVQKVWTGEKYLFVYITSGPGYKLKIYDLTDPENPLFKADYTVGVDLHKVSTKGNYMFVLYMYETTKIGSLEIVDISNPVNPQLKGTYKPSNYEGRSFFFSETLSRIYVAHYRNATNQGYIREIDYSTPTNPTQVRELIITGAPIEMSITGSTLFILKDGGWQGPSTLAAYNLDSSPITQLASLQVSNGRAWDMHVYGNSITVTLLEATGIKDYTWNSASKTFEAGPTLGINFLSQISWFTVSTQVGGSIQPLRKTLGGFWLYFYYYVLEKYPYGYDSETYGYYVRLIEKRIWIEIPDVKVTLITSVNPSDAAGDGCTVTPSGTIQYDINSFVTLDANSGSGWVWDKWTGALSGSIKPQQILMDVDKNIIANFQPILTLSLTSPADNYLCPPGQNEELTIATANIFVDGVNWMLTGISFSVVNAFKPDYTEAWIEYEGTKLKGTIAVDGNGYATSLSFSPNKQINEGNTFAVRLFFKFNYPSTAADKYIPAALNEVKKYKVSIHVRQVNCIPIPESARPGVKGPPYPPNIFYSNTQNVASVWNVSKNPNIPFTSIQEAVESAQTVDNDLIKLCPGWYKENVTLEKPLTIFSSAGAEYTIIEGPLKSDGKRNDIMIIKKSNTKISGLQLVKGRDAVSIQDSTQIIKKCEIKDCIFLNNSDDGVYLSDNADSNHIHNNYFNDDIHLVNAKWNIIEKNTVDNNKIYLAEDSQYNVIMENIIGNTDFGIYLSGKGVKHNTISKNTIGLGQDGKTAWPVSIGIEIRDSELNELSGNTIIAKDGKEDNCEIYLHEANYNIIKDNICGDESALSGTLPRKGGINIWWNSRNNTIDGNIIQGVFLSAISIKYSSHDNIIKNNSIGSKKGFFNEFELKNYSLAGVAVGDYCKNTIIDKNIFTSLPICIGLLQGANATEITNNKFGTDSTGKIGILTGSGVLINSSLNNVSNNLFVSCLVSVIIGGSRGDKNRNIVSNNKIGVDISGTVSFKNGIGVMLSDGANDNFIENNLISGQNSFGIAIYHSGTTQNYIQDNTLGVDVNITKALSNLNGIAVFDGANENYIRRNLICGSNSESGAALILDAYAYQNIIKDNYIGTDKSGMLKIPNNFGILTRSSNFNSIVHNKIWYNFVGIYENNSENYISQNDIQFNTQNTGIHLFNSKSQIIGNIIARDEYNGIKCENGSKPIITANNIFNNKGFGLFNADPNAKINAQNNYWGSTSSSAGFVQGNVNASNWLSSESKLILVASIDTLYLPEIGIDSVSVFYRNWNNVNDKLSITITSDKLNWITSSTIINADLSQSNSGESIIKFSLPMGTAKGESSKTIIKATSQYDPTLSATDTLITVVYKSSVNSIVIRPDSTSCSLGDTLQLSIASFDQHYNTITTPSEIIWTANGGIINNQGRFIAGNIEGIFHITATIVSNNNIKAIAKIKIGNSITSVDDKKKNDNLPIEFSLSQNYPNPFNPDTKIKFSLPQTSHFIISLYNILGQVVKELVDEEKLPGHYILNWNASRVASGIYICRMISTSSSQTFIKSIKMIFLK